MSQTILITGGAGYIGSHTAQLLAQNKYNIIIIDSFAHNQIFSTPWAEIIKTDINDIATLKSIFKHNNIHGVMHFAASTEVGKSVQFPHQFYENNVSNTLHLLKLMLDYGVNKFIFSSSCAVYGKPLYLPLDEHHPQNPISPYGKSKQMIESILQDFHTAYNLHYVSLRYFNAAGAFPEHGLGEQHSPETHIIPLIFQSALENKPFTIFGSDYPTPDGTAIRDYLHVRDIAQAHVNALHHLEQNNPSDVFNLGTGQGISVKQMVEAVQQTIQTELKIHYAKRRPGDPPILVANPSKAQNILQWKPDYSDITFIIKSAYTFASNHHSFLEKITKNQQ